MPADETKKNAIVQQSISSRYGYAYSVNLNYCYSASLFMIIKIPITAE